MLRKKSLVKYSILCIALLLCVSIAIFSGVGVYDSAPTANDTIVEPTANATLNATYGAFYHGSTYRYTDYTKAENMHSGAITDDTTVVEINSKSSHGSQENPFVIDSVARWNDFVADMADTSSGVTDYGESYYFVLAKDLDFSGIPFTPVTRFNGTFYGLGHTISNVSLSNTSNYGGLFLYGYGFTITDLNSDNYSYNDVKRYVGGIAGCAIEDYKILNCHTKGTMVGTTQTSVSYQMGGIIGFSSGGDGIASTAPAVNQIIYRCSSDFSVTGIRTTSTDAPVAGGIVGSVWHKSALSILDCSSNVRASNNTLTNSSALYTGVVGIIAECDSLRIESCTTNNYLDNIDLITYPMLGGLGGFWISNNSYQVNKFTAKNVYLVSHGRETGGVDVTFYPTVNYGHQDTVVNKVVFDLQNINYAGNGAIYGYQSSRSGIKGTTNVVNKSTRASSVSDLWTLAKSSDNALANSIWDKTKIDTTYSIENSPVINKLVKEQFDVDFFNYKKDSDESVGVSSTKYDYGTSGITLASPTEPNANYKFVGWTLDKTGEQTPFTTLPNNIYGNLKLYAVWDNPNTSASVSLFNSKTSDNTNTLEYGTGNIKLTATSNGTGMINPIKTFKWYKDSDTKAVESSDTCTLTGVKQSGKYYLEYKLQDSEEPLWTHTEKLTNAQEVTITKGKLKIDTFAIKSSTPAYFGIELSQVEFDVQVKDSGGNVVAGTKVVPRWELPGSNVKDGLNNTFNIVFTPDDMDNYDEQTLLISFNSDYVKLTFDMTLAINRKIEINLEYGQDYTSKKIVDMFLEEFRSHIVEPTDPSYDPDIHDFDANFKNVEDRTPQFDGVDINDFDIKYLNVTSPKKIVVSFEVKNYTVTFDPANGNAKRTESQRYNKFLIEPAKPTLMGNIFLGWFFDDVDENGNPTSRKWDFLNDRVKGDMTLTAKWFQATLTLQSVTVKPRRPLGYDALTVLQDGDLQVTAHYTTDSPTQPTMDEDLSMSGSNAYILAYEATDNKLHVLKPNITVTYTYSGVTKTVTIPLTVNPKKLDMSAINFADKTVVYDGSLKSIDPIPTNKLPTQISKVEYEYSQGGSTVDSTNITEVGIYSVTAKFTTNDPDYSADPMNATLTIARPASVLTVTWDNTSFAYNAQSQYPKATLTDIYGNDVTNDVMFHYEGDTNATAVGNRYSIEIVLDDSTYAIGSNATVSFSILKAKLDAPVLKDDMTITYDGGDKKFEDFFDINTDLIRIDNGGIGTDAGNYTAILSLKDTINCEWSSTSGATGGTVQVKWSIEKAHLTAVWDSDEHVADGNEFTPKVTSLIGIASTDLNAVDYENDIICKPSEGASKTEVGAYTIKAELNNPNEGWKKNYILDGNVDWAYVIVPQEGMQVITIEWLDTDLTFNGKVQMPSYIVWDKDGNDITEQVKDILTFGGDYDKSKWADDYQLTVNQPSNTYFIKSGLTCNYSISIDENGNGYNPNPDDGENDNKGGLSFDNIGEMLKEWWQVIASAISIILIIIFMSKGISYAGKKKQAKNTVKDKYTSYYAGATGLFGLAMTGWTAIACSLMGVAVLSLVFMIVEKKGYNKAERELENARDDFQRNQADIEYRRREEEARQRDENMRMMLMGMFGGQGNGGMGQGMPQGGYVVQQGIGVDEMRGLISETVTALLPGVQQAIPQQASTNDEMIKQIINSQEQFRERSQKQDETIKALMEKIVELSSNQNAPQQSQPHIIEKEVIKEVPVEKIVEVPVEVEKVVEKEVIKEVPVEKIVEKEIVKEVKVAVPVATPSKPKKETAPRLTLDEAYAQLTKQQQKYFDGLREYALSKDKCKEKKSTYFIVIGQSTVNPLIKLTIKKNMTVALFKMEDEYMKDIRRDASSDGTKVKVKETEVIISDAQSCKVAKNMIDLREDQIERYQELLREQRSMKKK